MKLIDSNIIIYSAFPSFSYLRPLVMDTDNFASAISKVEVLGYHKLSSAEKTYFESVFSVLQILAISDVVIETAIGFRQKHKMKLGDAIIAASAISLGAELFTRNISDFQMIPDLVVVNPIP